MELKKETSKTFGISFHSLECADAMLSNEVLGTLLGQVLLEPKFAKLEAREHSLPKGSVIQKECYQAKSFLTEPIPTSLI